MKGIQEMLSRSIAANIKAMLCHDTSLADASLLLYAQAKAPAAQLPPSSSRQPYDQ